jgi:hypothetical protein
MSLVFNIIFQIFFIHSGITAAIGLSIFVVHCIFCICYTGWKTDKRKDWAELSYKGFKNLYMIMPDNFSLNPSWVSYEAQGIEFKSYLDYLRYKRFFKRKEKWDVKIKQMKTQAELIKELKEGLKKAERENDEWVKGKIN